MSLNGNGTVPMTLSKDYTDVNVVSMEQNRTAVSRFWALVPDMSAEHQEFKWHK